MAFYRGEQGSVKFDDAGTTTATIASTRSWSMTIEKDVLETTALGATYKSNIGGLIAGSQMPMFTVLGVFTALSRDRAIKLRANTGGQPDPVTGISFFDQGLLPLSTNEMFNIVYDNIQMDHKDLVSAEVVLSENNDDLVLVNGGKYVINMSLAPVVNNNSVVKIKRKISQQQIQQYK